MCQDHQGLPRQFYKELCREGEGADKKKRWENNISEWTGFNPLSPNSDQHQFSPNNIHTISRD